MNPVNANPLFRPYPAAWPERKESRLACKPAFSLVELMIVLAILSLLAAMVVPNLRRNFDRNQIQDASRLLQEKLGELKLESSQSASPIMIQFGWNSGQLKISRLPDANLSSLASANSDSQGLSLDQPLEFDDSLSLEELNTATDSPWIDEYWSLPEDVFFRQQPQTPESQVASNTAADTNASSTTSGSNGLGATSSSDVLSSSNDTSGASTDGGAADSLSDNVDWSQPVIVDQQRFQTDQMIWVATQQWQCPLLLQSVSGRVQVGTIRPIQVTTVTAERSESETSTTDSSNPISENGGL